MLCSILFINMFVDGSVLLIFIVLLQIFCLSLGGEKIAHQRTGDASLTLHDGHKGVLLMRRRAKASISRQLLELLKWLLKWLQFIIYSNKIYFLKEQVKCYFHIGK